MLSIENLSCAYGNHVIFENVNVNLKSGALVVLHGPNGSGKTSLLHIIAGLLPAHHGRVNWDNKPIFYAMHDGEVTVNFIAHNHAVKPELSVYENLEFWAKLRGDEEKVPEALDIFGLSEFAYKHCSDLSAGWNKRVALARLVCCPSQVWILDEPYNNLDTKISETLDKMLATHCKNGGIAMLSTHTFVPIDFADKLNIANYAPKQQPLEYYDPS